jgi:hypothetical protein
LNGLDEIGRQPFGDLHFGAQGRHGHEVPPAARTTR